MIVLDTNVVSELVRPQPEPRVLAWVDRHDPAELFITAVTAAEVRHGVALLPTGRRRQRLAALTETLLTATFAEHVLPFDADASRHYAEVIARRRRAGRGTSALDAQQAAICRGHNATFATRNTPDFTHTGVDLIDPWTA